MNKLSAFERAIFFLLGILFSVIALEYYGYIKHSNVDSSTLIDEFRLLTLKPDYNVKISHRSSGKVSFCNEGYLLLKSENGSGASGILVDSKGRGIKCSQ
jgi:hypothetical protein